MRVALPPLLAATFPLSAALADGAAPDIRPAPDRPFAAEALADAAATAAEYCCIFHGLTDAGRRPRGRMACTED